MAVGGIRKLCLRHLFFDHGRLYASQRTTALRYRHAVPQTLRYRYLPENSGPLQFVV
jgi:hypothetical protein